MADSPDVSRFESPAPVLGALLSALVVSCGPSRVPRSAEATIAAYAAALQARDEAAALRLLTSAEQRRLGPEALARALAAQPREADELAAALRRAPPARVYAEIALEDGRTLRLEQEHDGFRLVDPLTRFYAQTSPRAALRSFVRAVERGRWDVVRALMPNSAQRGLAPEALERALAAERESLSRAAAQLASGDGAAIEVVGDRATMAYGESFTARFLREDGLWKLEDPD